MRVVIQRVSKAEVLIDDKAVAGIGNGLVILIGIKKDDNENMAKNIAKKCAELRIFEDDQDKFNLSAMDVKAEALVVSQFTLYADTSHGRRPSFTNAEEPVRAQQLYESFVGHLRENGVTVQTGVFGERMIVALENRGPVTIIMEE